MPLYLQTVVLKTLIKSENVTTTKLTEYSIYYSTEAEFSQNINKALKEKSDVIGWKRIGDKRIIF